ncbi:MAG TPA: hypothetical protein VMV32_02365 [Ignavibacteriaceae bacterium]|nr:hypothetical protein [Ignavibacteriaceae bacterium]
MTAFVALIYSFLFGLLHGILPDEHTWPITFSYAIGGANGKEGMKAGLYFSAAFAFQRAIISELAYLALAPFLLNPTVNSIVYIVVGAAMSIAGAIVLRKNRYIHIHFLGHHHENAGEIETTSGVLTKHHKEKAEQVAVPPVRWTIIHGFIAGFGFGGFSIFVNTVAAPAMSNAWLGFLPGLVFGLGTMIMLVIVGGLFGASLRWIHVFTEQEIKKIGSQTGGRTLFFGGILFGAAGAAILMGLDRHLPFDPGYALIALFMIIVAIPAFLYSLKEVLTARKLPSI